MRYFIQPVCVAMALFVVISGCDDGSSDLPIGKRCSIQFRRDALGAAMDLPVSPTTGGINGAVVQIGGKIVSVTPDWIVIEAGEGTNRTYVPRSVILLIEVSQ